MICQNCHKNQATVTVVEILPSSSEPAGPEPSTLEAPGDAGFPDLTAPAPVEESEGGATHGTSPSGKKFQEEQLCEICAQSKNLPHAPVVKKTLGDIWKLLQTSSQNAPKTEDLVCPDCGMTREEFRRKGRVGCARDYELFEHDVMEILERVHGATQHEGRLPGVTTADLSRMEEIAELKQRLQTAIQDEAYENAARIRDELEGLGD